jgi:hypothetical protein
LHYFAVHLRASAPQHIKLVSEDEDLRFQRNPRPEQSDQSAPDQSAKVTHRLRVSADSPSSVSGLGFGKGQLAKRGSSLDPSGYDAGKKIKGRKRHILVDTLGLLLNVVVHPADFQDRDGAFHLLRRARRLFPFIERIFADGGYAGHKMA